jgi:hypothetical protein
MEGGPFRRVPHSQEHAMSFIPPGGGPFSSIDQKAAYRAFKASGSFDPDALYAQKEAMLAPYRTLKRIAAVGAIAGTLLIAVFGMALVGVVLLVGASLLWWFQGVQARNVEAGYARYVGADTG